MSGGRREVTAICRTCATSALSTSAHTDERRLASATPATTTIPDDPYHRCASCWAKYSQFPVFRLVQAGGAMVEAGQRHSAGTAPAQQRGSGLPAPVAHATLLCAI